MDNLITPSEPEKNFFDYDTSLNERYHVAKVQTFGEAVNTLTGGTIASVVDFGASVWNSLPFTEEVQTEDLLRNVSDNALNVYEESPDAIHAASFIGGMFVPYVGATKMMNGIRAGATGVGWLSNATKQAKLTELADMMARGQQATKEYKSALRAVRGREIADNIVDAAVGEMALLGLMNAHPLLEDYWDNPVQNLGLALAGGAILGGGLGAIQAQGAIKTAAGAIEAGALSKIIKEVTPVREDMTTTVMLQTHEANIGSLQKILKEEELKGLTRESSLTSNYADKLLTYEQGAQRQLFEDMLKGNALESLPDDAKTALFDKVKADPAFWGVQEIKPVSMKDVLGNDISRVGGKAATAMTSEPALTKRVMNRKTGTEITKEQSSAYLPTHGAFVSTKDLPNFATVADLGKSADELEKSLPLSYGKQANLDSDLEIISKSSAQAQADIAGAVLRISKASDEQLAKMVVADNDVAALQAFYARLKSSPDSWRKTKVQIADSSGKGQSLLNRELPTLGAGADGRPTTYAKEVAKIASPESFSKYALYSERRASANLSAEARSLISDWIDGDLAKVRRAASDYLGKGMGRVPKELWSDDTKAFAELFESKASQDLRAKLKTLADADGNIFLYRGWSIGPKDIRGHHLIESYALEPSKSSQFLQGAGTNALYRVHVDDVIAGVNDIGGGASHAEILVTAGARPIEATLDKVGRAQFLNKAALKTTSSAATNAAYGADILEKLLIAKGKQADAMLAVGTPLQTISLKLDIPMPTLVAYAGGTDTLDDLVNVQGMPFMSMTSKEAIEEAVSAKNKAVAVKGNINKNQYAQLKANMDKQLLDNLNKLHLEDLMRSSGSSVARETADALFVEYEKPLAMLRASLAEVNPGNAGWAFGSSFDFFVRRMKDAGPVISAVGKRVETMRNNLIKQVVDPISSRMSTVAADPFAVTEFNTFVQLNHSLSGFRFYKEGQLWQRVPREVDGKAVMVEEAVTINGQPFKVVSPQVDELIQSMQQQGRELYKLANANRKITGTKALNDIGLWIPSGNPVGKFVAYVHDTSTDVVRMMTANSAESLASDVATYQSWLTSTGQKHTKIITKAQQREWSVLNNRSDAVMMQRASVSEFKGGSASLAIVPANREIFGELAAGYEHYITAETRKMADMAMSDITGTLRSMSELNNYWFKGQSLTDIQKAVKKPQDPAAVAHNVLLGSPNLKEYPGWQKLNQSFETGLSFALGAVSDVWNSTAGPLLAKANGPVASTWNKIRTAAGKEAKAPDLSKMDYDDFARGLEERGIFNPYQVFDDAAAAKFNIAKLTDAKDTSKRLVYASNALTATMLLRIGELAQPLVNVMSLPILTSLAKAQSTAGSFLGVQRAAGKVPNIAEAMYDGVRASNSPMFKHMDTLWAERGYYEPMVSEANNVLEHVRKFDSGAISSVEKALDSRMVEIMSKPADWSEAFVRRQTMFTGYMLAKKLYTGLDDTGATIFARDFMDKAVGNFHATQRPVFFQGTAGAALGLFQTYMLTLGQNIYRNLELKNYKQLGTAMLMQAGLFGAKSLPGFEPVSQIIGENFSDDHYDLTTGTYRALPDEMASIVLYGLPSNLGPAVYSRGTISPRFPNVAGGLENIAAVNSMMQVTRSLSHVADAMGRDNADMGRALAEAISLQSISRPLARVAEIGMGASITGQGNTVQVSEEVWSGVGIASRLLAMRPLEEAKIREIDAANNFYKSVDTENRKAVIQKLKTAIRNESLSDERIAAFAQDYFDKGGTPRGWRSASNEAIGRTSEPEKQYMLDKIDPSSPLQQMLQSL